MPVVTTRREIFAITGSAAAMILAGCGKKRRIASAPAAVPRAAAMERTETGIASWYGHPYHGRPAANGEIYDMEKMTAAHRTLPFNTWVRVTNLASGKTVDVRIIDRGPFVDGRIVDLSHAAARAIDLIGPGIASVRIDVIAAPAPAEQPPALYAVQVGAFMDRARAARLAADLQAKYGTAVMVPREGDRMLWRVLVGREASMNGATTLAEQIAAEGSDCFVVRLDQTPVAAVSTADRAAY